MLPSDTCRTRGYGACGDRDGDSSVRVEEAARKISALVQPAGRQIDRLMKCRVSIVPSDGRSRSRGVGETLRTLGTAEKATRSSLPGVTETMYTAPRSRDAQRSAARLGLLDRNQSLTREIRRSMSRLMTAGGEAAKEEMSIRPDLRQAADRRRRVPCCRLSMRTPLCEITSGLADWWQRRNRAGDCAQYSCAHLDPLPSVPPRRSRWSGL